MITEDNKKCRKVPQIFRCDICDYLTSHKSHYIKHLSTDKHKNNINDNNMITKVPKSAEIDEKVIYKTNYDNIYCKNMIDYACNCGQTYKFKSGLSRHKNKCVLNTQIKCNNINLVNDKLNDKDVIMTLIKENSELKHMMIDTQNKMLDTQTKMLNVIEKGTHNTNSHNKTFNLQFFLNDTCKDAMNITDFVNNLQLQLSDLEKMGEVGYVNGISNIIVKNLKDMDVTARPIHCTDVKREILYIKDEDKWDKETNNHPKVRTAIKHIAHKNSKLLNEFKEKYPDYNNSSSKISDQYNKILIESMGGKGDNDYEKESKIIKNLTKEVLLEKDK